MVRTFQLTKALSAMTVMDNMLLGSQDQPGERAQPLHRSGRCWRQREQEIRAKADELLDRFKLFEKADDYAGSLSGGQRKLLEMARALMSDPAMIMLDEPMAGVNPALTQSLLGHIETLRDTGHDGAVRRARHAHGAATSPTGSSSWRRASSSPKASPPTSCGTRPSSTRTSGRTTTRTSATTRCSRRTSTQAIAAGGGRAGQGAGGHRGVRRIGARRGRKED